MICIEILFQYSKIKVIEIQDLLFALYSIKMYVISSDLTEKVIYSLLQNNTHNERRKQPVVFSGE